MEQGQGSMHVTPETSGFYIHIFSQTSIVAQNHLYSSLQVKNKDKNIST